VRRIIGTEPTVSRIESIDIAEKPPFAENPSERELKREAILGWREIRSSTAGYTFK
jgi:hypothetical protein